MDNLRKCAQVLFVFSVIYFSI